MLDRPWNLITFHSNWFLNAVKGLCNSFCSRNKHFRHKNVSFSFTIGSLIMYVWNSSDPFLHWPGTPLSATCQKLSSNFFTSTSCWGPKACCPVDHLSCCHLWKTQKFHYDGHFKKACMIDEEIHYDTVGKLTNPIYMIMGKYGSPLMII